MNDTLKFNVVSMYFSIGYGEAVQFAMSKLGVPMEEAIDVVDECLDDQI